MSKGLEWFELVLCVCMCGWKNLDENWLHIYSLHACPVQSFPCMKNFNACVSMWETMSRQNFVEDKGNLLSSSFCYVDGFDSRRGRGNSPIDNSQNKRHPGCQAPSRGCRSCYTWQPCWVYQSTAARPGDAGCVLRLQSGYFFPASHRHTSFLLTISFFLHKTEILWSLLSPIYCFHRQCCSY